ncbi:hypothetical protein [Streptomyces mobaraensis]|uniref:Uncharacterized protein n=1 Tax=Streptomyces mobaraensis TaxID=35621 RepID=A0A5N5W133_STRMB|nr:hypothetical protein [Streptomyces mobaraensis]KAB7835510.1 hypothetical protein FRZ00_26840 [Streptomyces mobaraensis]
MLCLARPADYLGKPVLPPSVSAEDRGQFGKLGARRCAARGKDTVLNALSHAAVSYDGHKAVDMAEEQMGEAQRPGAQSALTAPEGQLPTLSRRAPPP